MWFHFAIMSMNRGKQKDLYRIYSLTSKIVHINILTLPYDYTDYGRFNSQRPIFLLGLIFVNSIYNQKGQKDMKGFNL